jgi:FixJ family two-component response regulator
MPQMGGAKLAAQLASDRPEMKVLFVSGYAETTFQRHGEIDVTTRFLQKPFSLKAQAGKIRASSTRRRPLPHAQLRRGNPARAACPI